MSTPTARLSYQEFINSLKNGSMYETMYEDSEGRTILVIQPAVLYYFITKLLRKHCGEAD